MARQPTFDSDRDKMPFGVVTPPPRNLWRLRRWEPDRPLRPFLRWFWMAEWDLTEFGPFETTTLPHPAANLVVEHGAATLFGPTTRAFTRVLTNKGATIGALFSPAGLSAFRAESVSNLVDNYCVAAKVFDSIPDDVASLVDPQNPDDTIDVVEQILNRHRPDQPDPRLVDVNTIVDSIASNRSLQTVDDVASFHHLSRRTLQRLFTNYVGIGPKRVIRRYRLQEAANLAIVDDNIDWSELASRLGYSDQAHLVRDFEQMAGTSPARHQRNLLSTEHWH